MSDFISTRGLAPAVNAFWAIINGLAQDGGLYVPVSLPAIDHKSLMGLSYHEIAAKILRAWFDDYDENTLLSMCTKAYTQRFYHSAVCPVKKLNDSWVVELYHGETCAFKDVALSMLPQLLAFARAQTKMQDKVLILTATSGDTGSAAMNGFKDVEGTGIITFFPETGVSPLQKRQMVCMEGKNVRACAVRGNFDDCQSAVKRAFAELPKAPGVSYSSANSINIARLVPQISYYFSTYLTLLERDELKSGEKLSFIVPTGNFGDILAGYYAKRMGLPIERLVCISNANRVLTDFIETGFYDRRRALQKTCSPSMDILISSNLERLLYCASQNDPQRVRAYMSELSQNGCYQADESAMRFIRESFDAYSFTDEQALDCIKHCFAETGYLMDPHTATAACALKPLKEKYPGIKLALLSTASPYKFTDAMCRALTLAPSADVFDTLRALEECSKTPIPSPLLRLQSAKERFTDVIDPSALSQYVKDMQNLVLTI
ncbi:MAG: threonine synthase [Clostridia bacterium]|nr:threonine synthase [Clostridia bacterium]